ncbi:PREDICTED: F-box/LRR-repeat protein 17 [Fragaria vesca subsp. vesca]|uniref:F-box/LRR-repeat protein 17 n=1 Tax=Fragaria vesca subsp. vesca TaxID=101020 RepID=UPI0002C2EC67|nr:PREDICTED: F-box/LRR-repeat protein 17 [Fragaria vesca subsp. vesca]
MEQRHHPHISSAGSTTPFGSTASYGHKRPKTRGSYTCGRCGQPKKGHVCHVRVAAAESGADSHPDTPISITRTPALLPPPPPRQPYSNLRRALSFDDVESSGYGDSDAPDPDPDLDEIEDTEMDWDMGWGGLPMSCLWEILRRLPPPGLLSAAMVCRGWRETTRRLWKAAESLRLRVPARAQVRFVRLVLHKCHDLVSLSLTIESDVDATMLECIAFSCPNLESMEIYTTGKAINRITGDELSRFVADRRLLKSLKMEGCSNIGGFALCSSSLLTLWLSGLHSLSKMVFNCPNLKEISIDFSRQGNDNTDLITMVDGLGRNCPRLQNIHIASVRLSHAVVLALTDAQLRDLRMLSLVLGSQITDASVAAVASTYPYLELLDLSGSSISDSGIQIICNVFPETLSRLLVALCPNITTMGIVFATTQLPLLELMDCGMTICDPNASDPTSEESSDFQLSMTSKAKAHLICQNLIIKHGRLKKLSLWGCTGLDALSLSCPELSDLNLNSCNNLHPERLSLQCPNLEKVHASGCQRMLIGAIHSQLHNTAATMESLLLPCKRLASGSKRIRVPHYMMEQSLQSYEDDKKRRRVERRPCNVLF